MKIVDHVLVYPGHDGKPFDPVPPAAAQTLFDYYIGSNGVFVWAQRPGLEVCFPIAEGEPIRGLAEVMELIEFSLPKIPAAYVATMLNLSRQACVTNGSAIEALFYLSYVDEETRWRLDKPKQQATGGSVRPVDDGPESSYARALIEVHSHHEMTAFFSGADDADEQGFRIYGVIGEIFSTPSLRVRVGVYGHFYELPADVIFEMPEGIQDANEEDKSLVETR